MQLGQEVGALPEEVDGVGDSDQSASSKDGKNEKFDGLEVMNTNRDGDSPENIANRSEKVVDVNL